MKRILFFIVAAMFAGQAWAQTTFEVGNLKYTVIEGTTNVSVAKGSTAPTGAIEIPPTVENDGTPYTVTSIGERAFYYCSGLTSVTIPNSVTSIGIEAFSGCSGLTSVTIPNSVTSIGDDAFKDCPIETLTFDTNAIGNTFSRMSTLKTINIGDKVTSISKSAFNGCSGLTSVTIPNSVTSIEMYAFRGCPIETLTFNTNAIGSVFSRMSTLKNINIGDKVTEIADDAFYGCSGLTSVTIGNSVTSIGYAAFGDCSSLTSVTIPNSVTGIGGSAFSGCSGLTSITIPESVTSIGENAFVGCDNLASITILTDTDVSGVGLKFTKDDFIYRVLSKNQVSVLPNSYSGDITIMESVTAGNTFTITGLERAFEGCGELTSVSLPRTITTIGNNTFSGCTALSSVVIPDKVTTIGNNAFNNCSSLAAIEIPASVESIGNNAFSGCAALSSVVIPDGVENIGSSAFSGCSGLGSITFGSSVAGIGSAVLAGCSGLQSIECKSEMPPIVWGDLLTGNNLQDAVIYESVDFKFPEGARMYRRVLPWSNFDATVMAAITVVSANPAMGIVIGNGSYMIGTRIEIVAIEKTGHHFVRWNDGVTDNPRSISIIGNATYTAEFEEHTFVVDAAVPATCTENGKTEGRHCSVCNTVLATQEVVLATGHNFVDDAAVEPTCTEHGLTAGKHCSLCNEKLVEQEVIAALGHTVVVDLAVPATCTVTGRTDGRHCSVCNAVLMEQRDVPAFGHEFITYTYNNDATTEADGTETATCEHGCGATDTRTAAGTKIATTPEDSGVAIGDEAASNRNIYAHHNIIVVENATDEIRVYDSMGRLVCRDATLSARNELKVNTAGVFIVKVGNIAKRVMVNY